MVNVIGDSHSYRLRNCCNIHPLSKPTTAFNLKRNIDEIYSIIGQDKSNWLFWFGEVDCRLHIYNQYMKRCLDNFDCLIKDTVTSYTDFLLSLPVSTGCISLPPTGTEDNIYNMEYYADRITRQEIIYLFNRELEHQCYSKSINYVNILPQFDTPSLVDPIYFEDDAHIKTSIIEQGFRDYMESYG